MGDNIKIYLKQTVYGSGDDLMAGCFEHGNESKDFMKEGWDILTR
jgi:hypothetical protein